MTRELDLQEILSNALDYYTADMYTMMPGIVITVDNVNSRVDVQPALNIRDEDGEISIARPVIINVPFQMPVTNRGGLTMPIDVGCPVELRWSMRGLDKWKRGNGNPDSPSDVRKFDIRDCIATPGIYPLAQGKNRPESRTMAHNPEDVVLVHNMGGGNEVEIRLTPSGDVFINSPASVTVNAANDVLVNCKNATVSASSSMTIDTVDFVVNSGSYTITTGTYSMTATDSATSTGNIAWSGEITLNGTAISTHDHGGVVSGGARTNAFGS